MISKLKKKIFIIENLFKQFFLKNTVFFIIDGFEWVIHEIALEKKKYLNTNFHITSSSKFITKSIIHFGSLNAFIVEAKKNNINKSNTCIVTIHHMTNNKNHIMLLQKYSKKINLWITSTEEVRNKLKLIINSNEIKNINICVDGNYFSKPKIKKLNKIFTIGSFLKDGSSTDETPKSVKGPDILLDVLVKLSQEMNFKVILSGPNREWIKKKLKENNINYEHKNLDYTNTLKLYNDIDILLVTSRIEGGPRCVMEAAFSKIPIISSNVGIIKDLFTNKQDALIVENLSIDKYIEYIKEIKSNSDLKEKIISGAYSKSYLFDIRIKINKYQSIYNDLKKLKN